VAMQRQPQLRRRGPPLLERIARQARHD
jgi:hypothetical protein